MALPWKLSTICLAVQKKTFRIAEQAAELQKGNELGRSRFRDLRTTQRSRYSHVRLSVCLSFFWVPRSQRLYEL